MQEKNVQHTKSHFQLAGAWGYTALNVDVWNNTILMFMKAFV